MFNPSVVALRRFSTCGIIIKSKMYKPVTGNDLLQYDAETRALYSKRQSDPRLTHALLTLPRASRNHLPVIANENDPTVRSFAEY